MAHYLYRNSYKEAVKNDEVKYWRLSYADNVACASFLDEKVAESFDGKHLPTEDIIKEACEKYGIERVGWVIANTVRENSHDSRFRLETQSWARTAFYIPPEETNGEFVLNSHSELINGLANAYRNHIENDLKIVGMKQCLPGSYNDNYKGKLLIMKSEALADEYKSGEYQYFMAQSGNGCNPNSLGTKVFGHFLTDGEKCFFERADFHGIADPEQLPEWVKNKLDDQDGGQSAALSLEEDGGMTLE